jgi:hypothetical protein
LVAGINRDHWPERHPATLFPAPTSVDDGEDPDDAPEAILWAALVIASPEGTTVPDLMAETGMSRPWVYLRLRELADQGKVTQVSRGSIKISKSRRITTPTQPRFWRASKAVVANSWRRS